MTTTLPDMSARRQHFRYDAAAAAAAAAHDVEAKQACTNARRVGSWFVLQVQTAMQACKHDGAQPRED